MPPVYAVIPARAGSRRLRNKNLHRLCGRTLLAWAVRQARACRGIDEVYVSTDSADYAREARRAGARVPFLRPSRLSRSVTPTAAVLRHLADRIGWRDDATIVLLQPTSPLREPQDIASCLRRYEAVGRRGSVISVRGEPRRGAASVRRRANGAVYVVSCGGLRSAGSVYAEPVRAFAMDTDRSIDIDTWGDFRAAARVMDRSGGLPPTMAPPPRSPRLTLPASREAGQGVGVGNPRPGIAAVAERRARVPARTVPRAGWRGARLGDEGSARGARRRRRSTMLQAAPIQTRNERGRAAV